MSQELKHQETLKESIQHFLVDWHKYPIDYWWRSKYNVPFGSPQHRSMNLIDMSVEYLEQIQMIKYMNQGEELEIEPEDENVVHMTQKEIDDDYENLDLSKF